MKELTENYIKFHTELSSEKKQELEKLSEGQSPRVLLLTCSDSRVEMAKMLGIEPGDVFCIRNAGNIVTKENNAEIGTIQFAVEVLKVKHIIICGHTECGAVMGMLNPEIISGLGCVETWLKNNQGSLDQSLSLTENIKNHILFQTDRLRTIDFIQSKIEAGELSLNSWILDLATYRIEAFDPIENQWCELSDNQLE